MQSYCFALLRGCDVTAVWFILSIRSLSNDNGDVNENGKTAIGLDWQNSKSARASRLLVRFFTVTAWLRPREMQNFTYCGEREYKTTTLLFFSWTFLKSFRIQLQHLTNWTRWNKCDEFAVLFIPSFYVLSGLFLWFTQFGGSSHCLKNSDTATYFKPMAFLTFSVPLRLRFWKKSLNGSPKKISYGGPRKWISHFTKLHLSHEIYRDLPVFSHFLWNLTIHFLGHPWEIFFGVIADD